MPFHARLADDDLHDLGFPKRSATIYFSYNGTVCAHAAHPQLLADNSLRQVCVCVCV